MCRVSLAHGESKKTAATLSGNSSQQNPASFTRRPPVFTSLCCKLVKHKLSTL
jgi:hypothetical protein